MIRRMLWKTVASVISLPLVRDAIIKWSKRTPYQHIIGPGGNVYMGRWWLFNAYDSKTYKSKYDWIPFNVRIHHIRVPDGDRHLHSHPWDARTVILKGEYVEQKEEGSYLRESGDTQLIRHEDYHRISYVPSEGVWTLFITYKYKGTWFFDVDGNKVQWRDYLDQQGRD